MIRPYELLIGLRYMRARQRHRMISMISLISIGAIALSITTLITVLSVMNGFGNEMRGRILSFVSHVTVSEPDHELRDWQTLGERVRDVAHVTAYAPYVSGQGVIARGQRVVGVMVRGISPEHERGVSSIADKVKSGSMEDLKSGTFGVIIGHRLATQLGASLDTKLSLLVPQAQPGPMGLLPRFRQFTVVGIFDTDMYEYDSQYVLLHLDDAAQLYQAPDRVTGLQLRLDDLYLAPRVAADIDYQLKGEFIVRNWTRENNAWFNALALEKKMMFVILSLIVCVAMFSVVSALVVLVNEKKADIAILRTLGASPRSVLSVFLLQGLFIGLLGTLAGIACGVSLAMNVGRLVAGLEWLLGSTFLEPQIYFLSRLPSEVLWGDVVTVALVSFCLALVSTLLPAWRASQTLPAQALRYE